MFKLSLTFLMMLLLCACNESAVQPLATPESSTKPNIPAESKPAEQPAPAPIEVPAPEVTDIRINQSTRKLRWEKSYTDAVMDELDRPEIEPLLKTKISSVDLQTLNCTTLNEQSFAKKKIFYIVFIAAIAEAESDFRVALRTRNPSDNTINVGLLQIDEQAARNHTKGSLGHLEAIDLVDPETNLRVGVHILKNQVLSKVARHRLLPERSYYWQVLSEERRVLLNLKTNFHNLPFCIKSVTRNI